MNAAKIAIGAALLVALLAAVMVSVQFRNSQATGATSFGPGKSVRDLKRMPDSAGLDGQDAGAEGTGGQGQSEPGSLPSSSTVETLPQFPAEFAESTRELRPLDVQREALLQIMSEYFSLDTDVVQKLAGIFNNSPYLGQGLPKVTEHPMSRAQCLKVRAPLGVLDSDAAACGAKNMSRVYARSRGEMASTANLCVDRFEFPNIPCEYPLTWVRSSAAAQICEVLGKRLCDAHEWEGACAGDLRPPEEEYFFGKPRLQAEYLSNQRRELVWSYGSVKNHALCGTGALKSPECFASGVKCGSNTFPAGSFPECKSAFDVYDLHGNAAEHMNLPLESKQLTSRGGSGRTEMKGSWFIFQQKEAHPDDCRWRAKNWHGSDVDDPHSHHNYHLGFRCCKTLGKSSDANPAKR
ncbi:MAG: SUMF1/EgtB/PvdO family nonheme iron enzyme [Polyangiaceae bacterium]|nr:SUMF1/EgtB/PvdO family nonheme iron enzyme [Polyangiaceae bacterium]